MQIDENLLSKLESLSALKIDDDSRAEVVSQLSNIVEFVEVLNELDLSHDEALSSAANGATPLRQDAPVASDVIDSVLKHAPVAKDHFFVVPKIIE